MFNIPPHEFYANYLSQVKFSSSVELLEEFQGENKDEKTKICASYDNGIYVLDIHFAKSNEKESLNIYDENEIDLYDERQSAFYVLTAVKHLALYREAINVYTVKYLRHIMRNAGKINTVAQMPRELLYKKLLLVAQQKARILKWDDKFEREPLILEIKPVYDPSHNPLLLKIGTRTFRVDFEKKGAQWNTYQYHILSIVDKLTKLNDTNAQSVQTFCEQYNYKQIPLELYNSRMDPLNKSKLYAVKLAQLYHDENQDKVEVAYKLLENVYKSYKSYKDKFDDDKIRELTENTLKNMISDYNMILFEGQKQRFGVHGTRLFF